MSRTTGRDHYSYTVYADPETARTFDDRRFGGPIGTLIAEEQARTITSFAGPLVNQPVLDVGAGTGRASLVLAEAGARVTAVDPSEEMLAVARRRAAERRVEIRFAIGDAHALDFPDRAFDVVVSLRVLMHTPRWRDCLSELCRVAGRRVIVDYPSRRSLALVQSVGRRVLGAVGIRTEAYRVFSDHEIRAAFEHSGFSVQGVHRQFVLPIAFHKAIGSRFFTEGSEALLKRIGLLRMFGSPVTIVAQRCSRS